MKYQNVKDEHVFLAGWEDRWVELVEEAGKLSLSGPMKTEFKWILGLCRELERETVATAMLSSMVSGAIEAKEEAEKALSSLRAVNGKHQKMIEKYKEQVASLEAALAAAKAAS